MTAVLQLEVECTEITAQGESGPFSDIDAFIDAIKLEAKSDRLTDQATRHLSDLAWTAISDYMDSYNFTLDESYVDQSLIADLVKDICSAYGRPDLAGWLQIYLYATWRHLLMDWECLIYNFTEDDPDEHGLHIACYHDDTHGKTCDQVSGMAYSSCTAQTGDAVRLKDIEKPVVASSMQQAVLDNIWKQLSDDDECPQGKVDHLLILQVVLELLAAAIRTGNGLLVEEGLASLQSRIKKLATIKSRKKTAPNASRAYKLADSLLVICHSALLESAVS